MGEVAIRRIIKSNSGFSLLEVIISIAALSFVSVFILQMFLVSSNVNKRAKDVDTALAEAISAIEGFKSQTSIDNYLTSADIDTVTEHDREITVYNYYDKDWKRINASDISDMPPDTVYYLQIGIAGNETPMDKKEGVLYGGLYNIAVDVVDVSSIETPRSLVSLQTKKYFSNI